MSKLLNVSSSPHVRSHETTHSIMLDVAIAMLPATAFGVYHFGMHALLVLIVTVAACVLSEYVYVEADEEAKHHQRLQCPGHGHDSGTEHASGDSGVDSCSGWNLCHYRGEAALRRPGTELYEPGSGSQMLPADFLCGKNDKFQLQRV